MEFTTRLDLQQLQTAVEAIRTEVGRVIIGQQEPLDLLLTALLADGHVLIEGVPGVAKTLMTKLLARTIDAQFSRIQFTPDLMPADVLGTSVFSPKTADFSYRPGPIFANIVLIDEINRAPAKTQSALFEVMEERQVTADGITHPMADPFLVLATQNPIEQEGTYRLPEAQLDRFLFKIVIGYPDQAEEIQVLRGHHERRNLAEAVAATRSILSPTQLAVLREQVRLVHVEENLFAYITQIVQATRANKSLYLGASPRASVALLNSAKAMATLRGRDFVTPEDIQALTAPVLRHRVLLTPEREMEGSTADDVIAELVKQIEVPR